MVAPIEGFFGGKIRGGERVGWETIALCYKNLCTIFLFNHTQVLFGSRKQGQGPAYTLTTARGTMSCHWASAQGLGLAAKRVWQPRAALARSPRLPDTQGPLTSFINTTSFWISQLLNLCQGSYLSPGLPVSYLPGFLPSAMTLFCPQAPGNSMPIHSALQVCKLCILLCILCRFCTSSSLSCRSVHLPSDHLQKLRNKEPQELPCHRRFCLGKWLINPNGFLLPKRFCIRNKCPFPLSPQSLAQWWPCL